MKDIDIRKALINRFLTLNDFSGIEFISFDTENKPTNVALPNVNFTVPNDKRYFVVNVLFDEPEQIGVMDFEQQRYTGFMQIDICIPKNTGEDEADNKFTHISKLFLEGTSFDGVDIDKVYKANTSEEGGIFRTIVRIDFTSDVVNM